MAGQGVGVGVVVVVVDVVVSSGICTTGVVLYWLHPAMIIKDTAQRRNAVFFMI